MRPSNNQAVIALHRSGTRLQASSRWVSLLVLCTGFLMIVVDGTIVNVALPSIQRNLGFSQSGLAWVVDAYLIAYAGVMLLAGRLGDLIGRKRIFLLGLALFTTASLVCGLSFSQPMLIAARFIQGIGGAASSAVILGMIVTMFPEQEARARAMGIFAFVASAGGAVGLLAGGLITQALSWHWIFFVNLPIGIATLIFGARLVEGDEGIGLREGADVLGAALVTGGLMLGVYAIVESNVFGLTAPRTLVLGAVAVALLAAFLVRQALAVRPLMPLRLFRLRTLSAANLIQGLMVAAFFAFFFLGTLDLQRVLHYGPMAIGLAFLPNTLAMALLSIELSARLITRFGARRVLLAGLACIVAGLALFAVSPMQANYVRDLLVPMVLVGIGAALSFTSLSLLAMSEVAPDDAGLASGLLNTTTQVAAALGLALLATVATSRTGQLLAQRYSLTASLSGAYHFSWAIGAGLVLVALVIAATWLRPAASAPVEASSPHDEMAREVAVVEAQCEQCA